ncbi:MAG TPA: hypothetical protein VGF56_00265 [Rhizomicrobium sp.]|jgi:hypothetical protein
MARNLEQDLNAALDPGERLLWSGRPQQGVVLRNPDAILIPLSLVWLGLAVAWEILVFVGDPDVPDEFDLWDIGFVFWGIPFVLVGLYFAFGRFVTDARLRANTIYGLTDHRILVLHEEKHRRQLRTLALNTLGALHLSERKDGRGTISFGAGGLYNPLAFEGIDQARAVLQRSRDAQRAPK